MKSSYTLLTIVLLFSLLCLGQKADSTTLLMKPAVKKGYYSIGDNSRKLLPNLWPAPDTFIGQRITKGYHSIKTDNSHLPKKSGWFRKDNRRPVITKGYYSIGDHLERLNSNK